MCCYNCFLSPLSNSVINLISLMLTVWATISGVLKFCYMYALFLHYDVITINY